ncbi:MAG: hypothetical protein ACLS3M_05610 [Collinsella sp.]
MPGRDALAAHGPCKLLPQAGGRARGGQDAAREHGRAERHRRGQVALAGEGRVLVRKSGTESVIRAGRSARPSICRCRHEAHRKCSEAF